MQKCKKWDKNVIDYLTDETEVDLQNLAEHLTKPMGNESRESSYHVSMQSRNMCRSMCACTSPTPHETFRRDWNSWGEPRHVWGVLCGIKNPTKSNQLSHVNPCPFAPPDIGSKSIGLHVIGLDGGEARFPENGETMHKPPWSLSYENKTKKLSNHLFSVLHTFFIFRLI